MIVPVLDLMIGQIVLAEGGNRDAYRPVQSRLTANSQPAAVAQAMFNQTGCDWLYLADIDSFAGAAPSWGVFNELLDLGFGLWVDANWLRGDAYRLIKSKVNRTDRLKVIVSSETLQSFDQFELLDQLRQEEFDVVFSLDKKGENVISQSSELTESSELELVHRACDKGIEEFIILDLSEVGTRRGYQTSSSASSLIEEIRSERGHLTLTSGGGVRNVDDIKRWIECGCDHVLVASAIHDCAITPDDASQFAGRAESG